MDKVKTLFIVIFAVFYTAAHGQTQFVRECGQHSFPNSVPAGNYSGITRLYGNTYAVVSDKSETDGFFVFNIDVDTLSGEIIDVRNLGFRGGDKPDADCEGIAFVPASETLFISRECDNQIVEYTPDGRTTGRKLAVPEAYISAIRPNSGIEALTYDNHTSTFWIINECTMTTDGEKPTPENGLSNMLRLLSFDADLNPCKQYFYETDAPSTNKHAAVYTTGVSEIAAADSGRIVVMEREFFVPKSKIGAFVNCKLYEIVPIDSLSINNMPAGTERKPVLPKHLICSFTTRLGLFNRSIANYEGMCFGPKLADGNSTLILVSDSQNRYGGVLKDFFKTIILR